MKTRNEVEEVVAKVQAYRAAYKKTLSGVELMQYNLLTRLRGWMLREDMRGVVCISDIIDKIKKYAPKAILESREQMIIAIDNLWRVTNDYPISSEDYLREDLDWQLSFIF